MQTLDLSVIIPVYNEEEGLPALFGRLYPALDALHLPYEIVFINDGSRDRSAALLREQFQKRSDVTRVILLNGNFGQHMAIMAGFAHARGLRVVTLDADLQNPPEEIGNLLAAMDRGHDYVGTIRRNRQDSAFRRYASRAMNRLRERITRVKMTDQGCMLRAYRREIVEQIVECDERSLFIPALANALARRTTEIEVGHAERLEGKSKYKPLKLMRLGFDLLTGFSLVPIQLVSLAGVVVAMAGVGFGIFLFIRRLIVGPEVEGVFTLFAILFVFLGLLILAVGLVGEYIGRIYLEVRHRPAYRVRAVYRHGEPQR